MVRAQRVLFSSLLLTVPFFGYSLFNLHDVPIGRPDIIVITLLALEFALSVLVIRRKIIFNRTMMWILWLNMATLLSAVNAFGNPSFSFSEFGTVTGQLIVGSVMVLAVSNLRIDKRGFMRLLQIWLLVSGAVGAYAIYQAFARNIGWPLGYLDLSNPSYGVKTAAGQFGGYVRASSVFFEPSVLGSYLVGPSLLVTITLAGSPRSGLLFKSRAVHWLLLFTIIGGVVCSLAMGAFVALLFAIIVMIFSSRKTLRATQLAKLGTGTLVGIGLTIATLHLFQVNFLSAFERVTRVALMPWSDGSLAERAARAVVGLKIWASYPFFGVGANQVQFVSGAYTFPSWYSYAGTAFASPHIMWISTLSQTGLFGTIGLALVFGSSLVLLRRSIDRCTDPDGRVLCFAFYIIVWSAIASLSLNFMEIMVWVQLAFVHLLVNNVRHFGLFRSDPTAVYPTAT